MSRADKCTEAYGRATSTSTSANSGARSHSGTSFSANSGADD
jgi:hypothetical protein